MEGYVKRIELGHALVEWLLQIEAEFCGRCFQSREIRHVALVALPEMQRVGKTGAHDLAVAVNDFLAAVARLDIGDQDEFVRERLFALLAGDEAFLVGLDRQPDDLGGDGKIILLEAAHQHLRPFDQAGNFLQQAFVLDQFEAVGEGDVAGVMQDDVLAPLGIEDDLRPFETCDVVVEAADGDCLGRMETMAVGDVGGGDASISNGMTTVSSCSGPKVQTIDCSGRTQRIAPGLEEALPQRMDFGQGKSRMMPGITSATISSAARPGFEMTAT